MNEIFELFPIDANADDVKKIAKLTHFVDKNGIEWTIKTSNIDILVDPIDTIATSYKAYNKKYNYGFQIYKYFFGRKRDYMDFTIEFRFNNSTITCNRTEDYYE